MKLNISKEWLLKMAEREGDSVIAAGVSPAGDNTHQALAFIHRVERDNAEDFASEIAADLRLERKRHDICGLALMMIREGCADPARVAAEALEKARNVLPA